MDKIVWQHLNSKDPRKPGVVAALRALAGHPTSRVTLVQVSKDGTQARGRVLAVDPEKLFEVGLTSNMFPMSLPTLALDMSSPKGIVNVAPTTTPAPDSLAQATTNQKETPTMSTATKTLRNILKRMGVKVSKDADEATTKKAFEEAVEAGKVPEQVSEAEQATLKELGYEVEGSAVPTAETEAPAKPKKGKKTKVTKPEAPAEEKPAKAKKAPKAPKAKGDKKMTFATWFRAFWEGLKTCTRDELYADFNKKFPDATEARGVQVVRFYIRDAKLQPKRWGFELSEGKDGKLTKGKGKAKEDAADLPTQTPETDTTGEE